MEMRLDDADVVTSDLSALSGSHDVERTRVVKCFVRLIVRGQLDGVAIDCDLFPMGRPQHTHLGHYVPPLLYLIGDHGFEVRMSTTM